MCIQGTVPVTLLLSSFFREMKRTVGKNIKEYIHSETFPLNASQRDSQPKMFPLDCDFNVVPDEWTNIFVVTTFNVRACCSHRMFCVRICIMWFTVCTCFLIKPVANISFVMSVRVYVRLSTLSSSVPTGRLFAKILYPGGWGFLLIFFGVSNCH